MSSLKTLTWIDEFIYVFIIYVTSDNKYIDGVVARVEDYKTK